MKRVLDRGERRRVLVVTAPGEHWAPGRARPGSPPLLLLGRRARLRGADIRGRRLRAARCERRCLRVAARHLEHVELLGQGGALAFHGHVPGPL